MSTPGATVTCEQLKESLVETTLEALRLQRMFRQVVDKLEVKDAQKYTNRIDYFLARIERNIQDAGLSISYLQEGEKYEPGMPVIALNMEEFNSDVDPLVIDQMIEPTILSNQGVQRVGTVMLRRDSK